VPGLASKAPNASSEPVVPVDEDQVNHQYQTSSGTRAQLKSAKFWFHFGMAPQHLRLSAGLLMPGSVEEADLNLDLLAAERYHHSGQCRVRW
jgi:hypothetical protein